MNLPKTRDERKAYDLANADWLDPVRQAFQQHMQTHECYAPMKTPKPCGTYTGSHAQMMWECWLAATLKAQLRWISADTPPEMHLEPGLWPKSDVVLVLTCGERLLAYREQVDEDCEPRWKDGGSEGWTLTGITHWMQLPAPPSASAPNDPSDNNQ